MGFFNGSKGASLLILAFAIIGSARAGEVFTVTTSFTSGDTFGAGELAAHIEACANPSGGGAFNTLNTDLQKQCVHKLISPTATCSVGAGNTVVCNINGVVIDTKDITFDCGDAGCPFADSALAASLPLESACGGAGDVAGYLAGSSCHESAFCLIKKETSFTHFGDFCPSATGDFCCSASAATDPAALPSGVTTVGQSNAADYIREVDHLVDMSFTVNYDVERPAKLKISVEVPYVKQATTYTREENGQSITYDACPTTYLIDFTPPVETIPRDHAGGDWLPLTYFPHADKVGQYRSSCANADFGAVSNEQDFITKFAKFHDQDSTALGYGKLPAVNTTVWGSSVTDGIPHGSNTFWRMETPVGDRVTYSTSKANGDYYDLVRAFSKCERYHDRQRLVLKSQADAQYINGVAYEVEEYRWELTVCQVGLFGRNCRDANKSPQSYAKTCAKVPAVFSVTPQQISSVAGIDASQNIVSKTFLQEVTSTPGACASAAEERYVITLNLIMMSTGYDIVSDEVHDLISPTGILGSQTDIAMQSEGAYETTAEFLTGKTAGGGSVAEGVYFLKKITSSVGGVSVYSHKVIIVTKCYNTGKVGPKRSYPDAFADSVKDASDSVRIDLEVIVQRSSGSVADAIKNTLNLRILANVESFRLPSEAEITRKEVAATQHLYGSYEVAQRDQATPFAEDLNVAGGLTLYGGDQVCSKHQAGENSLTVFDATVAVLTPSLVGACLLTSAGSSNTFRGQTIKYRTTAMVAGTSSDFTFGCTEPWLDMNGVSQDSEGVYEFPGASVPTLLMSSTHKRREFFVISENHNIADVGTGESHAARFGSGLMYFNATDGLYKVHKTDEMQISKATRDSQNVNAQHMTPGCQNSAGKLKSACNLVCFDLVDGILTDFQDDLDALVHHISVATIATEAESTDAKKFTARKSRRMLLESVTTVVGGLDRSLAAGQSADGNRGAAVAFKVSSRTANVTAPSDDDDDDDKLGLILGLGLGLPLGLVIVSGSIWFCLYRKREKENQKAAKQYQP